MTDDRGGPAGRVSEFATGWRVLAGAAFGVGLGVSGLLTYNLGLFTADLGPVIGLSASTYGAALLGLNLALAAAVPVVGRLVERFGPRAVATGGAAFLAGGFAALSQTRSVTGYLAVLVLMGLLASASAPVAHTRAVAGAFRRLRGLALGITQVGIGLAAATVPPLVARQIGSGGWQSGFLLLAGLALCGVVPALLGLPGRTGAAQSAANGREAFAQVRASSAFWLQLGAFTAMAAAFVGMIAHFVPMLRAGGVPLERAGGLAGLIGVSVILTRLVVGWLADHVEPAWLGAASCIVCASGALALALGGPSLAVPGAIALGCAIGAEADLIGILTARNFPIAAYSRAYAAQYAAFTVAGGVSPLVVGLVADSAGGYHAALLGSAGLLLIPTLMFVALARLPARPIPTRMGSDNS